MRKLLAVIMSVVCASCGGGGGGGGGQEPQQKKPGIVVFVHGGGWKMVPPVLPAPSTAGLPEMAARHGFDYIAITYPQATESYHSFPDAHRSVASQLIEMRNSYDAVYAIGSSAGANIVALAAIESPSSMDKAALYYGVYDLPAMDSGFNAEYSNLYASDLYAASPTHIGHIPVTHRLWHGSSDELVPYQQSTAYDDEHTTVVDGAPHGFTLMELTGPELEGFLFGE